MTPCTFETCDAFVLKFDGFRDDRAVGEDFATAYGVTEWTWQYAQEQGLIPEDKGIAEATADDCESIRRALYWNTIHGSSLPPGVALMVYNDGVLCGVGHVVRLLQRVLGAQQDGVIGPDTLRRAGSFGSKALIDALATADETYLAALANAPLYLTGWDRREEEARQLAYQMIAP